MELPGGSNSLVEYSEKLQEFSVRLREAERQRARAKERQQSMLSPSLRWFSQHISRFGLAGSIVLVTTVACITATAICFLAYALTGLDPFADPPLHLFLPISVPWLVTPPLAYPLVYTIRSLQRLQQELDEANLAVATFERQRLEIEGRLLEAATTDYLTGLYGRRAFFEAARREFARARRNGGTFSILILDLDHFKSVNDSYGHDAGDKALQLVSSVMVRMVRVVDLPARLGGEEFAVLLPETDAAEALGVAERLRLAIAGSDVQSKGGKFRVTASIGVATLSPLDQEPDHLIKAADQALFRAKSRGRNCVEPSEAR